MATGKPGDTVFEFIFRIDQQGAGFAGQGYLTAVAGLDPGVLFLPGGPRDEAHARFLTTADGTLVSRSVDGAVHSLDIAGHLAVTYSPSAGASWSEPAGFAQGTLLARYDLDLQDVLTVIMSPTGIPTLNGVATQLAAARVDGRPFGRRGMTARFTATGIGTRTDSPTDPIEQAEATLTVAGSMIAT